MALDQLEDSFDHMQLDWDTSASPANLTSESEPEHAHATQQHSAAALAVSRASEHAPRRFLRAPSFHCY